MRRSILLAGTTALALTLAACGGGGGNDETSAPAEDTAAESTEESTDEATEESTDDAGAAGSGDALVVWVDDNRKDAVQEAADRFTEETDVPVELVVKPQDSLRADFAAQVPTGEGPDITVGAHDWIGEMTSSGLVAPVELGAVADELDPAAVSAFTFEGQVYGVPYAIESVALIRNVDLAAEPAPATFDEMIAAGEATGAEYPFLVQVGDEGDPYHMYALQSSFGAPVFVQDEEGAYTSELGLGGEPGLAFAEWLKTQGEAGVLDTAISPDIAKEQFAAGNAPYILGGPWLIQDFEGMNLAVDPIPSAGGETAVPFSGVQGFYVSAQSDMVLDATDFLVNYIASEETQTALFEAGNRTPANIAAAEAVADDPIAAGFAAQAESAQPMPTLPEMAEVWAFWGVTQAQIISGQQEPADAWNKMVSDIEAAIAAAGA